MPTETKADLQARLMELGKFPPPGWSCLQLRARISELKALHQAQGHNQLKQQMAILNRAAKKKSSLQTYADQLGVKYTPNSTIAEIYSRAEEAVTSAVPPTAWDKVNFGKFADQTYVQVKVDHPDYASWVMKTAAESQDANWRLKRLAHWLTENLHVTMDTNHRPAPRPGRKTMRKGYPSDMGSTESSHLTDGSFERVTSESEDQIAKLKEELETIKAENAQLMLQNNRIKSRKEM
eukprot:s1303_g21.t1